VLTKIRYAIVVAFSFSLPAVGFAAAEVPQQPQPCPTTSPGRACSWATHPEFTQVAVDQSGGLQGGHRRGLTADA